MTAYRESDGGGSGLAASAALATTALGGSLQAQLGAAAAAGFGTVELFVDELDPGLSGAGLRRQLGDAGLQLSLLQPLRDVEARRDVEMDAALDRSAHLFDFAAEAGAPGVLVCSNVQADALADSDRSAAQLARVADLAAARGLQLSYEALSWGRHVRTWRQAWAIVLAADRPNLRLALDSFHTLALAGDVAGLAALPGERVGVLQLADAPWSGLDPRTWSRTLRCFPGEGELDVTGFTRAAFAGGYAGPVSLEVFNPAIRALPPREAAERAMASLRRLEASLAAAADEGAAA